MPLNESEIGSLIAFGLDALISYGLYKLYRSSCRAAEELKRAKKVEIQELPQLLKESPNQTIPYACVEGVTAAAGITLKSKYEDVEGVIQNISLVEHKSKRFNSTWSDSKNVIRDTIEAIPFYLYAQGYPQQQCHVSEPRSAEFLLDDLSVTYDKFEPSQSSVWQRGLDLVAGEVTKGFHELEKMLIVGTSLLGIGEITLEGGKIKLQPPSDGSRYILTRQSLSEITKSFETRSVIVKVVLSFTVLLGGGLMTFLIYSTYKKLKEWRRNAVMLEELRQARQAALANRQHTERNETTEEENACVICLNNPREVILLNCGHICLCFDCAPHLHPMKCPVCRQDVERYQAVYNP